MSFFVVPTFVPPTLEQLPTEPDEVSLIVKQEAKITAEVHGSAIAVRWGPRAPSWGRMGGAATPLPLRFLVRCSWQRCATTIERRSPWG